MRDIGCKELSVVVFTLPERQAILQASQLDPWKLGGGTAPVLSIAALDTMHLPPVVRYALPRAGMCVYGYTLHLTWLLEETGGPDLAWWGWPESGMALLAAGWSYQRALDDPILRAVASRLFDLPSSYSIGVALTPRTFPVLIPSVELHPSQESAWFGGKTRDASLN
ncbi:MAG: hypothetical protein H0V70_29580 [Ktedonobacteraceae bacterium]|nr:hypothetical protein [Ktedonobacteraceae bacterium]